MCLGNNFIASEGSFFFPLFASFGFFVLFCSVFCHVSFDDPTKITASCHLAWPCPGLGENGGEWIQKAWWCRVSDECLSVCPHGQQASANRSQGEQYYLFIHGGTEMVSALPTMSPVTYSTFLPRKSFPWPAPVPGGLEKDKLLGLTRDTSATGVKTRQLGWPRLVSR